MPGPASNPWIQYLGFENLKKYNNEHPDELHKQWMIRNDIPVPGEKGKRGRRPGSMSTCKRCGRKGHYAKTCKHGIDINGKPLWNFGGSK